MQFNKIRTHLRRLLKTSGEILEKVPNKDDNTLVTAVKIVSLADAAYEYLNGKDDPALEYLNQFSLIKKTNGQFVSLFFSSFLKREFKITNTTVEQDQRVIRADVPNNGTLFFTEWTYDGGEKSDVFYHTEDFDFKKLLSDIWNIYGGKIYVSISEGGWTRSKGAMFSQFPIPKDKIYGKAAPFLQKMIQKELQYRIDNIPRCFLFVGEPGTGKSSFAMHMTEKSDRVLKFNAKGLHSISADNINFLLDGLEPEYIIIDDIDRVMISSSLATLLSILDMIKETHPDTVLILTANDADELSQALKRPGRIDEIIEFEAQDKDERKEILVGYLEAFKSNLSDNQVEMVVDATDGFTAAYMRELAIQAKYLSFDDLITFISNVNKYAFGKEIIKEDIKEKKKHKKKKH
jgi:hypothetical protein